MDWIATIAGNALLVTVSITVLAGVVIFLRTGMASPIYTRLLKLFISRDEVEDPIIRQSLADQAALASFRVSHGVQAETLADARKIINFGNQKNIPLYLLGRAGDAFSVDTLSMVPGKVPSNAWATASTAGLGVSWILMCMLGFLAIGDELLVSLRKTDTWVYISATEARVAFSMGTRGTLFASSCESDADNSAVPSGFDPRDPAILCTVWSDPAIAPYLANEIAKQRNAALLTLMVLFIPMFHFGREIRNRLATIRLNKAISSSIAVPVETMGVHLSTTEAKPAI